MVYFFVIIINIAAVGIGCCSEKTEKSRSQSWPILYQSSTSGNRKIAAEE